jgi:hypothetical protein
MIAVPYALLAAHIVYDDEDDPDPIAATPFTCENRQVASRVNSLHPVAPASRTPVTPPRSRTTGRSER